MTAWGDQYIQALRAQTPFAGARASGAALSLQDAYALQAECVAACTGQLGKTVRGYKAALTAAAAQQAMDVDTPIAGVLFSDGEVSPDSSFTPARAALLETELGYTLREGVTRPVDTAQAESLIASCHPMMEIASPNLSGKPGGIDLVAANSAAYAYVQGPALALQTAALDTLEVSLHGPQGECFSGRGGEVMQGQAAALAWLINRVLESGYPVEPGHLFMTGSIGGIVPAAPGTYVARFGNLQELVLTITG